MNLSMLILDDWMKDHDIETDSNIEVGEVCIKGVRISVSEQKNLNFVNISMDNENIILSNGEDTIKIQDANFENIINLANEAIEYYGDWERELTRCLVEKRPIQDFLDTAHKVFNRPMFIKSIGSWIYAITKGYDPGIHPYWHDMEDSILNKTSDFASVKDISLDEKFRQIFTMKYPIVVESPTYKGCVLHSNVWLEENRICEIVTLENNRPFSKGDTQLMSVFTEIVENFMKINDPLYLSYSGLASFFTRLLDGNGIIRENIKFIYRNTGWKKEDEYIVFCIESKTKSDTPIVRVLKHKLREAFANSSVFVYNDHIVCVTNMTKTDKYEQIIKKVRKLIPVDAFNWGVSYEFASIEQFIEYYKQAEMVLTYALENKKNYLTMYQTAYLCITEKIREIEGFHQYIHPDILKLTEYDRENRTNYVKTLFEYLLCGGNYTDTANRLGLHRNSLIYRITKIEEKISRNLDNYENKKLLLTGMLLIFSE